MTQIHQTPVSIVEHFSDLTDPRIDRTKQHSLVDIIGLAICGVMCGADGWTEIEEFGHAKHEWLRTFLALPNGIPSHDTIGRVFARLLPGEFHGRFHRWIQAISTVTRGQVLAIDGKTLRRSYDRRHDKAAIHMVSAWATANHLILGQVKTNAKSNEITAIPELLEILAIQGCIVTIDAMGCQTAIAAQIINQGADYVLALKGNQGHAYQQVVAFFDQFHGPLPAKPSAGKRRPGTTPPQDVGQQAINAQQQGQQQAAWDVATVTAETVDGDHGRIEVRRSWQVSDLTWFEERSQWKHLQSIGMVEAERDVGGRITIERRYYLASLRSDVPRFAEAVRGHWGIENRVHWSLDVSFREDDSRIRTGHAPENFAVFRHIALNLLKQDTQCPRGMKTKRLKAGWDNQYLTHILFSGGQMRLPWAQA